MSIKAVRVFDEGGELKVGLQNAANDPLIAIKLCATGVTNHISVEANDIIYNPPFRALQSRFQMERMCPCPLSNG